MMKIPFWEKAFKKDSTFLFGSSPNQTIVDFEHLFNRDWNILDVGCGDGKNSFYLAKKGFKFIDAFDISENAINKLNRISISEKLQINTKVTSVQDFAFEKKYDLIMSFGVYHFIKKEDWKAFVKTAQENTNIGGIHIIQLFNDNIAPSPDIAEFAVGLAKDGEISQLYTDGWEILHFSSYEFEESHPGVPLHKHASNKLVARKIY